MYPSREALAGLLGVGGVLGDSAAYSLNFGINTCAASKIFPSSSLPEVSLRLPRKGGVGYAKHVLPSHPLPLLAAAGLGLKPSNPPCRLLLVKMGKSPSPLSSYSANHIMALKAFLHDYLVFNFKWVLPFFYLFSKRRELALHELKTHRPQASTRQTFFFFLF